MSASEKLKALELYMKSPILQDNALAATRYYRALPQIVAVVEAAEREAPFEERGGNTGDLRRTLAALEEALS